mmetsp:Transcript_115216/g.204224  ORF Transcript_115216/g.204224 Transcript_115216/m.204224 type:complete len:124 (-) Transcript_115216:113-484(-)
MGTTSPQTADQYVRENREDFAESKEEMTRIIELPVPRQARAEETGNMEEVLEQQCAMWTMEEELVVERAASPYSAEGSLMLSFKPWLRGIACVMAVASAAFSLLRGLDKRLSSGQPGGEKYYV